MSNVVINPFVLEVAAGDPSIVYFYDPLNDGALPGGSTFTRASVAQEYDGTDFTELGSGIIREDSVQAFGGAKGYLPEPEATNTLITVDLSDAAWTAGDVTVTDNGTNSLGLTEYDLAADATTAIHRTFDNAQSGGAGSAYIISANNGNEFVSLMRGSSGVFDYATFDVSSGSVEEEGIGIVESLTTSLGSGFFKCELNTTDGSNILRICNNNTGTPGNAQQSFLGVDESVLVCHVQYEATIYSTTPIITSGSTLTRQADVLDTGIVIASEFSALLDLTLPSVIGSGNTISLLGADATSTDILIVDDTFDIIMSDGGTTTVVGTTSAGSRIKVSYGRDGSGRSASLDGATAVTGDAPSASHEGDTFQLGCTNSVNQSRCIHHTSTLYDVKKSDVELEALSS